MPIESKNFVIVCRAIIIVAIIFSGILKTKSQNIPKALAGVWKTDSTKLTMRQKIKFMKYKFTYDKVIVTLNIASKNNITGTIGGAEFNNACYKKNKGNPDVNGIAYIIDCGKIGKISGKDPTGLKKIELWIKPIIHSGTMNAEIRLRDGWDTFPMGELLFIQIQ